MVELVELVVTCRGKTREEVLAELKRFIRKQEGIICNTQDMGYSREVLDTGEYQGWSVNRRIYEVEQ
jgi:hypothetical protein